MVPCMKVRIPDPQLEADGLAACRRAQSAITLALIAREDGDRDRAEAALTRAALELTNLETMLEKRT